MSSSGDDESCSNLENESDDERQSSNDNSERYEIIKGTRNRFKSKILGISAGAMLQPIVVLSDTTCGDKMYCVHREWVNLKEGVVDTPFVTNRKMKEEDLEAVIDYLIINAYPSTTVKLPWTVKKKNNVEQIQLNLQWKRYLIKMLYADFSMYFNAWNYNSPRIALYFSSY